MRAISYEITGDADVLALREVAEPTPGPGEVAVRMHRSGVNPTDIKRRGESPGTTIDPAQVPGQDGAGVVEQAGPGVDAALVGQRVWLWEAAWQRPSGTAQEVALALATRVVPLPQAASFDLGAALGIPFITAHRCLTTNTDGPQRLQPGSLTGRTVLVAGGAGAVGNAAIQLARWAGATVLTTVSSDEKAALATAAGAHHVINYRTGDPGAEISALAPDGVHTIVEVAPAANVDLDRTVAAPNATVAVYASEGGADLTMPVRATFVKNIRYQYVFIYEVPEQAKADAVADIAAAVAADAIRVGEDAGLPLHHFSLDAAADAHRAVDGGAVGKVLIDVPE